MTQTTAKTVYSFEEYLTYDDGTDNRYELIDGRLDLVNPATFRHLLNKIIYFLQLLYERI